MNFMEAPTKKKKGACLEQIRLLVVEEKVEKFRRGTKKQKPPRMLVPKAGLEPARGCPH